MGNLGFVKDRIAPIIRATSTWLAKIQVMFAQGVKYINPLAFAKPLKVNTNIEIIFSMVLI